MRNDAQKLKRRLKNATLTLCIICGLICSAKCTAYNPSLYPSYDVLNPGSEVLKNPIGFVTYDEGTGAWVIEWNTAHGFTPDASEKYVIINEAMSQWVAELKEEIKRLR